MTRIGHNVIANESVGMYKYLYYCYYQMFLNFEWNKDGRTRIRVSTLCHGALVGEKQAEHQFSYLQE